MAQGAKCRNMGVVELNIRIRDFKKPWLFHVLADLEYPCILGIFFIGGSKIIFDFDRNSLAIQESQVEDINKWAEIIPFKKASARVIADNFFDNYILRFGAPIKLISDNGPQFISDIFENLSERLGIRHVKTVVYRPQANRTERVNRDLVQMIANYVNEQHG
ncbi:retrovirus-related Pol polyprotein from transposon 297, partial [Trichonephila clavipes]